MPQKNHKKKFLLVLVRSQDYLVSIFNADETVIGNTLYFFASSTVNLSPLLLTLTAIPFCVSKMSRGAITCVMLVV